MILMISGVTVTKQIFSSVKEKCAVKEPEEFQGDGLQIHGDTYEGKYETVLISYLEDLKSIEMYLVSDRSQDLLCPLHSVHRHVQSMCCVTYLVQVYVDLDMS